MKYIIFILILTSCSSSFYTKEYSNPKAEYGTFYERE